MSPPYIGGNRKFRTKSLFVEFENRTDEDLEPVFSLVHDYPGMINCRKTFVATGDPTGYKWAIQYLDSWKHFEQLLQAPWFREHYDDWIKELTQKIRSAAVAKITELAEEGPPATQLTASKLLADEVWNPASKSKRGRPSSEEVKGELKKAVTQATIEDEDMARMGLKVIQGGKNA